MAFLVLGQSVIAAPKIASGAKKLNFRSHVEFAGRVECRGALIYKYKSFDDNII